MALDEDEGRKDGRSNNGATHDDEGILVVEVTESESEADGSGVSSGTDDSRDGSSGRGVDVGDNSVRGSLGGLDEDGEEDHDDDGSSQGRSVGKDKDESSLDGKTESVDGKTSPHSALGVASVGQESSETTGEQVHPAKDGSDGGGRLGGLVEFLTEVQSSGVVHGELDSEAASVLDEEEPSVDVEGSVTEGGGGRDLGHGTVFLHLGVVTLRGIIGDHVHSNCGDEGDDGWDDGDRTPGLFGVIVEESLEEREEKGSHHELGDTSSEVSPSSDKGVGGSNDLLGEHAARPVLAHDEGSTGNSNEQTEDSKSFGRVDKSSAGGGDARNAQNDAEEDTGTVLVAGGSKNETHEDGSSDTDDGGRPDLLLGQAKRVLDLRKERSDGEPDEEGNEEAPPRAVEGTHVRAREVAQLDLGGLVILVGIDVQDVRLVLLDLLGLSIWTGKGWKGETGRHRE